MTSLFKNPLSALQRRRHLNRTNSDRNSNHNNNHEKGGKVQRQRAASWSAGRIHGGTSAAAAVVAGVVVDNKGVPLSHNNKDSSGRHQAPSSGHHRRPFLLGRSFTRKKKSSSGNGAPTTTESLDGGDSKTFCQSSCRSSRQGQASRRLSSETFALSQVSQDLYPKSSFVTMSGTGVSSSAAAPATPAVDQQGVLTDHTLSSLDKTEFSTERHESSSSIISVMAMGNSMTLGHPPLHHHNNSSSAVSTTTLSTTATTSAMSTSTLTTAAVGSSSLRSASTTTPKPLNEAASSSLQKSVRFADRVMVHPSALDWDSLAQCNLWYTHAERSRFQTLNEVLARHINQKASSAHTSWKQQQHSHQNEEGGDDGHDAPSPSGTTCLFWLATLERVYDALCALVDQDDDLLEEEDGGDGNGTTPPTALTASKTTNASSSSTSLLSRHKRRALRKVYESVPHASSPSASFRQYSGDSKQHEYLCPLGLEHVMVEWIKEDRFCRRLEQMEMVQTVKATMQTPYTERSHQFIQETSQGISRLSTLLAQETALALAASERALRKREVALADLREEARGVDKEIAQSV
mmetsp:Transcript_11374/g.31387  ORF Transcript_11374/g.31387 Transcript_11374/m.31387 type:complete len:577 (-) Transcript_11374:160-1890(-)